jgi:hypothetical protein
MDNQPQRTEGDLNWLGAIIDGEGCVTATAGHTKTGHGHLYKHRRYIPNISIVNTDQKIVEEVFRVFDSVGIPYWVNFRLANKKHPTWKPKWEILINGMKRCLKASNILIPYTRSVKKDRLIAMREWINRRLDTNQKKEYDEEDYRLLELIRSSSVMLRDYTSNPTTVGEDIVHATA